MIGCLLLEELRLFLEILYLALELLDLFVFFLLDDLELLLVLLVPFIQYLGHVDFGHPGLFLLD